MYAASKCSEWHPAKLSGNFSSLRIFKTGGVNKNTWAVPKIESRQLTWAMEVIDVPRKSLRNPVVLVLNISPQKTSYAERSCWTIVCCLRFFFWLPGCMMLPFAGRWSMDQRIARGAQERGKSRGWGACEKRAAQPSLPPYPSPPPIGQVVAWGDGYGSRNVRMAETHLRMTDFPARHVVDKNHDHLG